MTASRAGLDLDQADREDYLARTLPMPAIDIAGYEAALQASYQDIKPAPAPLESGSGLARIARGGAVNLVGAIVSAAATVGLTVIVARNFSQAAVGTFFVATSLFLIVEAVTNLGAYNGTIYFIARLRALNAERRIPAIIRATIVPVAVSSVIGAALMFAFGYPLARLLDGQVADGLGAQGMATAIRVLAVALPFAALADTMLGATRGYHQMQPTVVVDRIGRSSLQLLGVVTAALVSSSALLAPLWALPYLPAALCAGFWLRRTIRLSQAEPVTSPDPAPPILTSADRAAVGNRHGKPNARGFWRFTAPRSMASLAQIVIQRLDIVLVGILRGPADAAIYTAATRFLVAGQLGNAAISMAAQPQLTRLFAVHDRAAVNEVYQATTSWLIVLTWPLYLLAIVFGPSVLAIFGRSYHAGSAVMVILASTMLLATACGQVDMVLITAGKSSWSLYNGLSAMAVNIVADLILIPRMGIIGAAIGWAAAIAVSNLVPLVQVAAAARVHPFGRGTAAACALTAVSFAVIPVGLRALAGSGPVISVAAIGLGCLTMALGGWRMRATLHLAAMPGLGRLAPATRPGG
jgi:O-antigen/teichoic acid export membrane protein